MLRTRAVADSHEIDALREEWRSLVRASPEATPFQTWEWQSAWRATYGRARRPWIVEVREGNDLVGLMPFAVSRGLWRALRPAGIGPSDYLHPLARSGYERGVSEAVVTATESAPADLVDWHQVRDDRAVFDLLGDRPTAPQATCLVLDLPKRWDDYLARLSKSLRYDVRRLERQAADAELTWADADSCDAALDLFFDLHAARWRRRGLPGAFLGSARAFHRRWVRDAVREGWLWMPVLRWKGEPVGVLYAMRLGSATYFYQSGFSPEAKAISPGTLLVAAVLRRSIEDGASEFDFLRGDEPYKRRWQPQREHQNVRVTTAVPAPLGRAAKRWNDAGSRVEARLRARFEGRGL